MSTNATTVAVTGATNGIGLAIAERLAAEGHALTLVGRDPDKLAAAQARIGGETVRADFAVLDEVRALADAIDGVDVVVSNAATVAPLDARTVDGRQRTVQVNHLAPYLLLRELAEGDRPPKRIVIVGADPVSLARRPVDLDDLEAPPELAADEAALAPFVLYGRTKNLNAMTMVGLARRVDPARTTVVGAHPGVIGGTDLAKESPGVEAVVHERFGIDPATLPGPEAGADTPAWLATAPDVEHGAFYVQREPVALAEHVTDPARVDRLWALSQRLSMYSSTGIADSDS